MSPLPTLLCLHGLGASGRSWSALAAAYEGPCETPDLPGFGGARQLLSPSLEAYAAWAVERMAAIEGPVVLVGWSMGGKIALVAAARRPERLAGLVLLAPSPPGGEPIAEPQRRAFVADGPTRENAAANADQSPGAPLPPPVRAQAVADWLASDPATFRWWFSTGASRVIDVSAVDVPVLILGGSHDARLGAVAQAGLTAPRLADPEVRSLPGVGHLIPREAPRPAAERITAWCEAL